MRLTTKLIRHILMPAVILALFIGGTFRYYNKQRARASVEGDLARTGQIVSQLLTYRVQGNQQALSNLLSQHELRELLAALPSGVDPELQEELSDACTLVLNNAEGAIAVQLFDHEGERVIEVSRNSVSTEPFNAADLEWFVRAQAEGSAFTWEHDSIGRLTYRYDVESEGDAYGSLIFDVYDIAAPTFRLATTHGLGDLFLRLYGTDNKIHLEVGETLFEEDQPLFTTVSAAFCEGLIKFFVPSSAVQREVELYEMQVLWIISLIFFVLLCSIWVGLRDNVLLPVDGMMNVVGAFQRGEKTPVIPSNSRKKSDELDELDRTLRGATHKSYKAQELLNALNHTLEERVADRTRELRTARDAAQAANRAKSAFLANMSHEIRTPLNGILGMTYPLFDGDLSEAQAEAVKIIRSSGEALLAIINDILDLSRIEAGKLTVERIPYDLRHCLSSIVTMLSNEAEAKGLELHLEYGEEVSQCIYGDPGRMRQVLVNLVSNAIKFTEEGRIEIQARVEPAEEGRRDLVIDVVDTGVGIPPEKIDSIFDAFSQADTSNKREHGGTGLGLTISQQIVEALGGSLTVESEVGRGSRFTIRLAFEPATSHDTGKQDLTSDGTRWRILVVDDKLSNQKVAEYQLQKLGCEVDCVGNGRAAIARLETESYHLVFMDCQLPVLDGYETTREIRNRGIAAGTPIVAMTASAMSGDREKCLHAGMDDYLPKPFGPEQVQMILTKWLAPSAVSLSV